MTAERRGRGWRIGLRLLLVLGALELGSWGALKILGLRGVVFRTVPTRALSEAQAAGVRMLLDGENRYLVHSPELGWTVAPGGAAGLYHASARGVREPEPTSTEGTRRILAFGDSFTHGDEVTDSESWPAQLGAIPGFAVWNYGVPGYGPDQAWLRWKGEQTPPADLVILGVVPVDLPRTTSRFVPFLSPESGLAMAKPRFELDGDRLVEVANPLPALPDYRALLEDPAPTLARLGEGDAWYEAGLHESALDVSATVRLLRLGLHTARSPSGRPGSTPYDPASEPFRITTSILAIWRSEAAARGQELVVLLLPTDLDLAAASAGKPPAYAPLKAWLQAHDLRAIDALPAALETPEAQRFEPGGHYQPALNARIAALVAAALSG